MIVFDLGALVAPHAGDGQLYHSGALGPAAFHNCTFEAARETLVSYGYVAPEDNVLRDSVAAGTTSGEPWSVSQAAIAKFAPDLPTAVEWPSDPAAAIRAYGEQGFIVHIGFWCDTNAWVPPQGPIVGSHAAIAVAADASGVQFKNPWPHPSYMLSDAQIQSLYDNDGILVFKRDIKEVGLLDKTDPVVRDLLSYGQRLIYMLGGTWPTNPADPNYGYEHPELATSTKVDGILAKVGAPAADLSAIVAAANDAKAAAVAAQTAAQNAAQTVEAAANVISKAAADIAAIRAKTDKDLA